MKSIIIILFLLPLFCKAQEENTPSAGINAKYDTVKVLLLISDTSKSNGSILTVLSSTSTFKSATYPVEYYTNKTNWDFGYSVRELHNTAEGVIDAGGVSCVDESGIYIPCYHDYWQHLYFLDKDKQPLSKNIIVWQSKEIK